MIVPPYPYKFKSPRTVVQHSGSCINHIHMIDSKHASIMECVGFCIRAIAICQHHDIAVIGVGVNSVLTPTNVVRSVIDLHDAMRIHLVVFEVDFFRRLADVRIRIASR